MIVDYGAASSELVAQIQSSGISHKRMLDDLLAQSKAWKPKGYDEHQLRRRHYYEGKGRAYLEAALAKRFKKSWQKMPTISLNLVRQIATQDAACYDDVITRSIHVDGEALPDDDEKAEAFAKLCRDAKLHLVLAEGERRLMVAWTLFLRVGWDPLRKSPTVTLFWPHDVHVVCHPRYPTDLRYAIAVLLRITGPSGVEGTGISAPPEKTTWEVWGRKAVDTDATGVDLGPWHVRHIRGDGASTSPHDDEQAKYPLQTLPLVAWHAAIPDGSIFLDVDHDLVDTVDAINVGWSDLFYTQDYQGHSTVWAAAPSLLAGPTPEGGPGAFIPLDANESMGTLSMDPKLEDMREGITLLTKQLANTRSQSPDAYSTSRAAPESGVARQISNLPMEKARRERQEFNRCMEVELLPLLVEQHNAYGDHPIAIPEGADYVVHYADTPEFEEPSAKQARLEADYHNGVITLPELIVESGRAKTVDEAKAILATRGAEPSALDADPVTGKSRLGDRLGKPALSAAPLPDAGAIPSAGDAVADTAMNGAQVSGLVEIMVQVAEGTLTQETARPLIKAAFPAIPDVLVEQMIAGIKPVEKKDPPPPFGFGRPPAPPVKPDDAKADEKPSKGA